MRTFNTTTTRQARMICVPSAATILNNNNYTAAAAANLFNHQRYLHNAAMFNSNYSWKGLTNILAKTSSNFRGNPYQSQFCCCYSTDIDDGFPSSTSSELVRLPTAIENKCQEWEKILLAEMDAIGSNNKLRWFSYPMKCKNVLNNQNTIKLYLDVNKIPLSKRQSIFTQFHIGVSVELRQSSNDSNNKLRFEMNLYGIVKKHFADLGLICVVINIHNQKKPIILEEADKFKGLDFEIREDNIVNKQVQGRAQLEFLFKRHVEWSTMPGYATLLNSFGLIKSMETQQANELSDQFITKFKTNFDQSQREALSALLDWNRPIVAVHGPAGSGKSWLLAHYLRIMNKQGKRVLVISSSMAELYHLMGQYCGITPEDERNFACLQRLPHGLLSNLIQNPTIQKDIEKRCFVKTTFDQVPEAEEYYKGSKKIEKEPKEFRKEFSNFDPVEVQQAFHAEALSLSNIEEKKLFEQSDQFRIVFSTLSIANLNMFNRMGIGFDAIIFDHDEGLTEYECWWAALPLTSNIRLFSDVQQPQKPMKSTIGQKSQSEGTISLLARLDKQENANVINCHLNQQYRSNPVIHEWPNRVFYKERAAEPSQSAKDISLENSLLEVPRKMEKSFFLPTAPLITDPLVLVDLSKLEGAWQAQMLKATKTMGNSIYNWGEAILAGTHISQLIERTNLDTSRIAYICLKRPQLLKISNIMRALYPNKPLNIAYGALRAHDAEVALHSFVIAPDNVFTDKYYLKYFASKMTRAKRQFMLFARREWLAEGSPQSRQLLDTFLTKGRVCGPNDVCPLEKPEQFHDIIRTVKANSMGQTQQGNNAQNNNMNRKDRKY